MPLRYLRLTYRTYVPLLLRSFDTVVECQKGYIKKCATPLQKELFDFFLESFTKTVEEFCQNPENKQSKYFIKL